MSAQRRQEWKLLSRHSWMTATDDLSQPGKSCPYPYSLLNIARLTALEGDFRLETDGYWSHTDGSHPSLIDGLILRVEWRKVFADTISQVIGGIKTDAEVDHLRLHGGARRMIHREALRRDACCGAGKGFSIFRHRV